MQVVKDHIARANISSGSMRIILVTCTEFKNYSGRRVVVIRELARISTYGVAVAKWVTKVIYHEYARTTVSGC